VLGAGLSGNTLAVDLKTLGLGFLLGLIVGVDALNEGLAGAGLTDVLNAEMKSLGDNAGVDALVDNDTDGVPGNIEDLAGLAVVELVGHTTLATAVGDNVNVISLLVDGEEVLQTNGTVLTVGLGKQISRASSQTKGAGRASVTATALPGGNEDDDADDDNLTPSASRSPGWYSKAGGGADFLRIDFLPAGAGTRSRSLPAACLLPPLSFLFSAERFPGPPRPTGGPPMTGATVSAGPWVVLERSTELGSGTTRGGERCGKSGLFFVHGCSDLPPGCDKKGSASSCCKSA